jgi:hypothetical protein
MNPRRIRRGIRLARPIPTKRLQMAQLFCRASRQHDQHLDFIRGKSNFRAASTSADLKNLAGKVRLNQPLADNQHDQRFVVEA